MKYFVLAVLALGFLSACSHEVDLTYKCEPAGAKIYQQGVGEVGTCPVTVRYNSDDVAVHDGKLYTASAKAVWVSGATAFLPPAEVEIPDNDQIIMTLTRPPGVLDSDRDVRFGLAYDQSLPVTQRIYVVTPNQNKNLFAAINRGITCGFQGMISDVEARCSY